MEIVLTLIRQVLIMYALMFIGYFSYRKKFLSDEGARDIGKILLNIVICTVIISNLYVEKTPEKTAELLSSSLFSLLCMALSIMVSYLIFHRKNRIAEFACAFSNAGFIGIRLFRRPLAIRRSSIFRRCWCWSHYYSGPMVSIPSPTTENISI